MAAKLQRLEARVDAKQKSLLQRAAKLQGRTLTDFVIHAAQEAAIQIIERHKFLELSERGQKTFVDALLSPPNPVPAFVAAAERYRKLTAQ
jgi:uncharacterized protein (DUF1778 family)